MAKRILIDFACNDPDNGAFAGRFSQIHLPESALELTCRNWSITSLRGCPKLRDNGSTIATSGKPWPITRRVHWHGNWCWNGYWMTAETAQAFLTWLHKRQTFQCEGGWVELCDAWDADTLPADFVARFVAGLTPPAEPAIAAS